MTCMIWASQALKSKIESRLGKTHNILIRVEHYPTHLGFFNSFHSIDDMIKPNHGAKSNKNDKLYQGSANCHIYWPCRLEEEPTCFRFDRKIQQAF